MCKEKKQTLSLEPLHKGETNFINSCVEAISILDDVPGLFLTPDCYHIFTEKFDINNEIIESIEGFCLRKSNKERL